MHKLVLLRHGQSQWNLENRFTGWTDVDLTARGREEAAGAAVLLREAGITFDVGFTSLQVRAIRTLWITLDGLQRLWIPVHRSWRLNERSYGALEGLNKAETAARYGDDQVLIWRRSYDVPPPALSRDDPRYPGHDPRYADVSPDDLPLAECLKDTVARFMPYWREEIAPTLRTGKTVVVAAHGNTLRALVKHLDGISDDDIVSVNIPTGAPLIYELDDELRPIKNYYLGDQAAIAEAMQAVASQGRAKA